MATEDNEQCKTLSEDYIRLIKDVGSREALTRRFFLIYQYEAIGRNESDDYSKIYSMLMTAEQTARAYFLQCGNNILQPKNPDVATAEIACLYFYFQYRRKHRPKKVSHAEKQVRRSLRRKRGKYEAD